MLADGLDPGEFFQWRFTKLADGGDPAVVEQFHTCRTNVFHLSQIVFFHNFLLLQWPRLRAGLQLQIPAKPRYR